MERFMTRVYQCRVCGSIICTSEGVERHEKYCRLTDDAEIRRNPRNFNQMAIVDFPCPKILLDKLITSKVKMSQSENEISRRTRPRPRYRELSDTGDEEDSVEEDEESEIESFSESDLDGEVEVTPTNSKKKFASKPENPYGCPVKGCKVRLKRPYKLKWHFLSHLENNPFACPIPECNAKLSDQYHFKQHLECHSDKHRVSCKKCGQSIATPNSLKYHKCDLKLSKNKGGKRTIKTNEEDVIDCLRSHLAKLKSKGFLLTENTDSITTTDLNYLKLIDIDAIIKNDPIFLQICQENPNFKNRVFANERLVIKNGEVYKCKNCKFTSGSLKRFKVHYSQKHSSRPWRCAKCGLTFTMEVFLETHMKFHESTGNNVYVKRLECGKYECTKCKLVSKHEFSLTRHWRVVHNITIPGHRKVLPKAGKRRRRKRTSTPANKAEEDRISTIKNVDNPDYHESVQEDAVINVKAEPDMELEMIVDQVDCGLPNIKREIAI